MHQAWFIPYLAHPTGMRLNKICRQAYFVQIFPQHSLRCGKTYSYSAPLFAAAFGDSRPFRAAPRLVRPLDFMKFQMKGKLSVWNSMKSGRC